jgi:EmrB/QacA subfamily drug resistance transporter
MSTTYRTSKVITLVVTCLGSFMILLDASIVTLALPRTQADLHAQLSDLQWIVDAYILPFAALMLTAGTLGDRFGRKRLFLVGLVLFLLGSTLCGFAPALSWLLFGRVVQGVGAAALSTGSLSVLAAAFSGPRERAQAIGIWAGIAGVALAAGPLLGGLLVQVWSWPAIFFVNLPIGLLALALAWPGLSESRNPDARHIDLPGQLLVIAGLTCLVMAIIQGSSQGWTSPLILSLFLGAVVLLTAFLLVETRVREPLLPLRLFGMRVFSVANTAALIVGFASLAPIFFLAQYFQQVQGATVLEAGLRTFPISIGAFLTAPFAGRLAGRVGPRLPIVLGALLESGALFLLMRLEPASSYVSIWWILGMMGIGFGLMLSPLTAAVLSATPPTRAGLGSSMFNTSNRLGNTLGIAVLGAFVLQQFSSNITSQLTQRGVPASISATIANKIAAAGAGASQAPGPGHLPLPPAALHQAINQAFVDALHGSFLIAGIALLVTAVLVAFLLQQKQPATKTSGAPADVQVTTAASAQPQVTNSGPNRSRAQQPEADPQVLAALSSASDGRYPDDWSEEQRGRAVAQEVIEPLSILLLTSSGSGEAGNANGGALAASEMVPDAGEMPT